MNIKLMIATHKNYKLPKDGIYYPVHVGSYGKESIGYQRDDQGENISIKNPNYCELTGLYWAWKNLDCDYFGLVHYRRHFVGSKAKDKWDRVISSKQLVGLLRKTDIIMPKKRNYFIETTYDQYVHAHHAKDLDITRDIIKEKYPSYLSEFDSCMISTKGHKFNMFIMKKQYADQYCEWLFDILFELERRLDISSYSSYDARVFGFVSERLIDVWLNTNHLTYQELPVVFMEKQNWFNKGINFLKRKFLNKDRC